MGICDYMTESEHDIACFEAVVENKINHLNYEFENLLLEHELRISNIDTYAVINNYNESTLLDFYMKEAEETKSGFAGIIQKIGQIFQDILDKIHQIFTGKVAEKIPKDKQIKIDKDKDPNTRAKQGNTIASTIKNILNFKTPDGKLDKGKLFKAIGGGVLVYTAAKTFLNNADRPKREGDQIVHKQKNGDTIVLGNISDALSNLDRSTENLSNAVKNMLNNKEVQKNESFFKEVTQLAQALLRDARETPGGYRYILGKIWNKGKEAVNNAKETIKNGVKNAVNNAVNGDDGIVDADEDKSNHNKNNAKPIDNNNRPSDDDIIDI